MFGGLPGVFGAVLASASVLGHRGRAGSGASVHPCARHQGTLSRVAEGGWPCSGGAWWK